MKQMVRAFIVHGLAMFIITSCDNNHSKLDKSMDMKTSGKENTIFPKGLLATENFTGNAYVNTLVPKSGETTYAVGDVIFEPGCRNNWHIHKVRQILMVIDGKGWYQEKGKAAQPLKKGDVIVIPANVEHWHGATRSDRLEHVVITDFQGDECVVWLNPVTDEVYDILPDSF